MGSFACSSCATSRRESAISNWQCATVHMASVFKVVVVVVEVVVVVVVVVQVPSTFLT